MFCTVTTAQYSTAQYSTVLYCAATCSSAGHRWALVTAAHCHCRETVTLVSSLCCHASRAVVSATISNTRLLFSISMWWRKRHWAPASQKWIEGSDHFVLTASLLRHNLMQIHFSPGWHFVTQLQGGSGQPGPGPGMLIVLLVWCDVWSWATDWATEERCNIAAVSSSPLLSSRSP